MARRLWEACKSLLILLLLCSTFLLTLLALPTETVRALPLPGFVTRLLALPEGDIPLDATLQGSTAAATPMLISIRQETGRATVRRSSAQLDDAYEQFSVFFAQALATCRNPISYTDPWTFLDLPGVLFSYGAGIPADVLALWLGQPECPVTETFGEYLLTCEETVALYAIDGDRVTRFVTEISRQELLEALSQYTPDGTEFAALRESADSAPLTLWESSVQLPDYTAEPLITGSTSQILAAALDFNPYGTGTYTDPQGNTLYTESSRRLSIYPDGQVELLAEESHYTRFNALSQSAADLLDAAGRLLSVISAELDDDVRLHFSGIQRQGTQTVLTYRYVLDGTPVFPDAVQVTFEGTAFTALRATLLHFQREDTVSTLMPIAQAAAISSPDKRLIPAYDLSSGGTLRPGWREL